MSVKDNRVDVRYHMNTGEAHHVVHNTNVTHLCLKEGMNVLSRTAISYNKFKPYYSRVSWDGKYPMEY